MCPDTVSSACLVFPLKMKPVLPYSTLLKAHWLKRQQHETLPQTEHTVRMNCKYIILSGYTSGRPYSMLYMWQGFIHFLDETKNSDEISVCWKEKLGWNVPRHGE